MCLRGLLLVSGLFLSSWALTPEECQPLVTPLSLADPSMMCGRSYILAVYNDNDVFEAILKSLKSSWMNVTDSPSGVFTSQLTKLNGTCLLERETVNFTFEENTASVSFNNMSMMMHILPGGDGLAVMSLNNTIKYSDLVFKKLNIPSENREDISVRALYLMGREATLKDSDLEEFKKQASCLGFSGEPQFIYNPENGFCTEEESIKG
ncbi:Saxitoxin and tetrodotoxin-binding protein 1 [Dissostichus eleginoides]|uniref:Saxitoxin and tetrodotoxin-binding protein 1 n=1 Tax=Dissostichus eleginoides TaxID=100907 RepID=A0AAD9B858_DISEL|nr:Saxitoxin and tetrodotoxin-binding protein 1 [Dissostichus eleginoides]